MDTYNIYHEDRCDVGDYLENYFSDKPGKAFGNLKVPIENLNEAFTEGCIRGNMLIDLSVGSCVNHLYSVCEFFKHIIVLKVSDECIMELKRWMETRTAPINCGHATKMNFDRKENSYYLLDKEEKVRSAVQHVVKWDLENENMMDSIVLPPANCIISAWLLDVISKDQDDYIRYLRKFSRFLKPGGHLILVGCIGATYLKVGKDKFHTFSYDEDFARKALVGEGFIIDYCEVKEKAVSDLSDYKAIIVIAAHKEKNKCFFS